MSIEHIFPGFPELPGRQPSREFVVMSPNVFEVPMIGNITLEKITFDAGQTDCYGVVTFREQEGAGSVGIPYTTQNDIEQQTRAELEEVRGDPKETATTLEPSHYFLDTTVGFGTALLGLVSSRATVLKEIAEAQQTVLEKRERSTRILAITDNLLSVGGLAVVAGSVWNPFDIPELTGFGVVGGAMVTLSAAYSGLFTRESIRYNKKERDNLEKLDHTRYLLEGLRINLENCKNPSWNGVVFMKGKEEEHTRVRHMRYRG